MEKSLHEERACMSYLRVGERLPTFEHIDWQATPRPFKVYQGCEQIALAYESPSGGPPVQETSWHTSGAISFEQCGQLLSDIYGFTRLHRAVTMLSQEPSPWGRIRLLRPVPSGGALFPCELYLLVGLDQCLPPGIYHYDALHHAL
ncbi:MAG TPA: hypothetical protein VFU49_14605, partial [Ktedonobacteraceae bacterium]|nr:hypothetical protein [Ktedonobacteraceae bacterium]